MIRECIVTTIAADGAPHLAPLGLIEHGALWTIAPFRPSATLDNLRSMPFATASFTDDVRVFAGCVTGRHDWKLLPAVRVRPPRLAAALAHAELAVTAVTEDVLRPRFYCTVVHRAMHAPFTGFNRAQAAVVEAAILLSRRHMLPHDAITAEFAALADRVSKTAGPSEAEAWGWIVAAHAG